jgi:hypothetical protein
MYSMAQIYNKKSPRKGVKKEENRTDDQMTNNKKTRQQNGRKQNVQINRGEKRIEHGEISSKNEKRIRKMGEEEKSEHRHKKEERAREHEPHDKGCSIMKQQRLSFLHTCSATNEAED